MLLIEDQSLLHRYSFIVALLLYQPQGPFLKSFQLNNYFYFRLFQTIIIF